MLTQTFLRKYRVSPSIVLTFVDVRALIRLGYRTCINKVSIVVRYCQSIVNIPGGPMPRDLQGARRCVGVQTWVCSAGEYRTRSWPRKRTLHARTCAHVRTHVYKRTYVCMYARIHTRMYAFTHSCTPTRVLWRRPSCETGHHRENSQLLTEKWEYVCSRWWCTLLLGISRRISHRICISWRAPEVFDRLEKWSRPRWKHWRRKFNLPAGGLVKLRVGRERYR